MANIGQTVLRFCGALVLAGGATLVDHPQLWRGSDPTQPIAAVSDRSTPESRPFEVRITQGKRAYGIRITNDSASLATLQPNSRVAILVVIEDPNVPGKRVAKIFMENMRLLAIGSGVHGVVASVEVTAEEAEQLAIAASKGSLQLLPRGNGK